MPDPGTHVLAAYWLRRFILKPKLIDMPVFLLGSIWPDIVSRGGMILFSNHYYWFFNMLHTPLSLLLQCIIVALLFKRALQSSVFVSMLCGISIHLMLDSLQSHLAEGAYFWLYPFSTWTTEIGLFPVHVWPYLLAGSAMLIAISAAIEKLLQGKNEAA